MIDFYTYQTIGGRESQQDDVAYLAVAPNQHLFVLADGMGGHSGGETASQTTIQAFLDYFRHPIADESPADALHAALLRANSALHTLVLQQPHLQGMGTTVLAVLMRDDGQFDYISVGDSPLYHWVSGSLKRINANHAFAEDLANMVAAGNISAEEAAHHPHRHAITSALMGEEIAKLDQSSGSLKVGERLILASDGIHSLADDECGEIATLIADHANADLAQMLCQAVEAKQLPHQDNTSVIAVANGAVSLRVVDTPKTLITHENEIKSMQQSHQIKIAWKPMMLGMVLAAILVMLAAWYVLAKHSPAPPPKLPETSAASSL